MSTTTNTYLQNLLAGIYSTMRIGRDSLRVGNDGYHLLCAIQDYGEQEVVIALARIIADEEGISFIEASSKAAYYIQGVLHASAGNGYGKRARDSLAG
ncbi:hypothetical protein [Pseudescherichia sp.]|uniref:hypothetical protein n=1 Tax=Pseudescherichia sp. TaxID=2055881 RepID=UPI0028A0516E|nr:hypothetical protein [Pseudescherichia sp.]